MLPKKEGQIVRFHTPLADEDPDQIYVVLELKEDRERSRADIQALGTGWEFPPISTVLLSDLEVVEVGTSDLIGHQVTINKPDYSQIEGNVVSVSEQKIDLDLSKGVKGVETNVWLTVLDKNGVEHRGTLYVTP
ncbi:hypothetical protein [Kaistella faecalis]|uniref:hypothetical protein n=1 Tax=Kaistella faecalis TaxID=2852098 RepID=UPI001C46953E|nr:hypothetical protein [Chryseobacterium faecale]UFK97703.1 hypothetical protein LL667_12190 [Chryseobacterium faecale]